jgi:hypothetical protein
MDQETTAAADDYLDQIQKIITVRLTARQHVLVKARARDAGMSLNKFCVEALTQPPDAPKPLGFRPHNTEERNPDEAAVD